MKKLGCIADDFTGGTDLSARLANRGFRTIQTFAPLATEQFGTADAVVIALKTRSMAPAAAVAASREALAWLLSMGCDRFYFKYCSTFDSTADGNIGPVIDALLMDLGEDFTIVSPALPSNGRTVFCGHMFVRSQLLAESEMASHPLTPMKDSNLVRVLQTQCRARVGLIGHNVVRQGVQAIHAEITALTGNGIQVAIADATTTSDVESLAEATRNMRLITGSAGLATGLRPSAALPAENLNFPVGRKAILAGSCSPTTLAQIQFVRGQMKTFKLEPAALATNFDATLASAFDWYALLADDDKPVLIYGSDTSAAVAAAQAEFGVHEIAKNMERALALIAIHLVARGVRQLIVAGGETAGAVVNGLKITSLCIGQEISPGVPWTIARGASEPIALALKSGNFGGDDFFAHAWAQLYES